MLSLDRIKKVGEIASHVTGNIFAGYIANEKLRKHEELT